MKNPNWTLVYIAVIILALLTGTLGIGFNIAFNAHSTPALIGAVVALLVYAPIVVKLCRAIGRQFDKSGEN